MKVKTVCVVGGGTMGAGIAHVSALAGYETCLFDLSTEILERAYANIERRLNKGVELGKLEAEQVTGALERLYLVDNLEEACKDTQLVIEAVPEIVELKKEIFATADRVTGGSAILATNTSGLSVTEMASAVSDPSRFAGMHFFNPVHLMKLVEIVRGVQSSDDTVAALCHVAEKMGKETVVVRDSAGFATSRVNAVIGNEAFRMLEQGVASVEDIDTALRLGLNHPMGPFELVDLVGLDVRLKVLENLHHVFGEAYRPSPLLRKLVEAGRFGKKVGQGVYRYDEEGKRIPGSGGEGLRG